MRRGFTLVEILLAVLLLGVLTTYAVFTFNAVTTGWLIAGESLDKNRTADAALDQVVSALRCAYYPRSGSQNSDYGFYFEPGQNGELGEKNSDKISWVKLGSAIVGSKSEFADVPHRVQLLMLEEGNDDYSKTAVEVTGLYARMCPDLAIRDSSLADKSDTDYTLGNDEDMYEPILVAKDVQGFQCEVLKDNNTETEWEDMFETSNAIPYKVKLVMYVGSSEEGRNKVDVAPLVRIVRLPLYEQSQDGAATPSASANKDSGGG